MWLIGLAQAAEEVCAAYAESATDVEVSDISDVGIESSGLAQARGLDDVYYTHGDSGSQAELYLFHGDGTYIGAQEISGATNTDWEDIAAGPCPATVDAEHCIWIADTGDNDEVRDSIDLWVVPESTQAIETAAHCSLAYPEGKRHDTEAILVSPDLTVRLVTKADTAKVYRIDTPACDGDTETLTEEAELSLDEHVTGGAMNAEGTEVVLRSNLTAWVWTGCSIHWTDTPTSLNLGYQGQGEAVAIADDGTLLTNSEDEVFRMWSTPCSDTEKLACSTCGCGGEGAGVLLAAPLLGAWSRRRRRR